MRRRSEPNTFDERLSTEEALITAALENTGPGPRRNCLNLSFGRSKLPVLSAAGSHRRVCAPHPEQQ